MKKLAATVTRFHYAIVAALLCLMFGLGVTSMAHDSAIVDELAHIPAGYSYLHYGDYRLNPEHPPLIKALAALPLQFMNVTFPLTNPAWTTDVNGQWESGWHFLYHDGNDANRILFAARLPILLLSVAFAAVFYEILRRRFGVGVGLLGVFLYTLEPNILAHSRFVTTDVGVMIFVFLAVYGFVRFLEHPNFKTGAAAAVLLALAQLSKFSAVILVPLYIFLVVVAITTWQSPKTWQKRAKLYGWGFVGIGAVAFALVWLAYIPLVIHMPADVQQRLVAGSLMGGPQRALGLKLVSYNHNLVMKALAQYILGVLMVLTRVGGGNTTYLLGHVTNQSFWWYFPITYLIKTPVALLLLILATLSAAVTAYFRKTPRLVWHNFQQFSRHHFWRLTAASFVIFYGYLSITGNLNLGIRHLLPMFPFIIMLVAYGTVALGRKLRTKRPWPAVVLMLIMIYYALANFLIYPSYLAYFNELIGGPNNAYKYVSDSSVDWGQDLERLHDYVETNHIDHIAVDYFGGGEPKYYFCDRLHNPDGSLIKDSAGYDCSHSPYIEWHAQNGLYRGYMAVSETFLENDIFYAPLRGDSGYAALRTMTPVAKVGYSIYIFKVQ